MTLREKAIRQNNYSDFKATCSNSTIVKGDKCDYKFCHMFGAKTLIYWHESGRVSTRNEFKAPF